MKRLLSTVYLTVFFGCFFGNAQSVLSINFTPVASIPTDPGNISQFEVRGKLITQNSTTAVPTSLTQTGSFDPTASWNSMGNINFNAVTPNLTQTINGFRSQTKGRGLAWGYSTPAPGQPNAGVLTNPFIEWIGNSGASVTPGNLEFKYALSPTGAAATRVPIFTMSPSPTPFAPAICYAENNTLLGQLRGGSFGSFTTNDSWSATGLVSTQNFLTYGARHQFEGVTLISGIIKDLFSQNINAVMDFGSNKPLGISLNSFKFRTFSNPNDRNTVKNVWQSDPTYGNVMMGRQEIGAGNSANFYLSVLDGAASVASATVLGFVSRSAIYATTDGNGIDGGSFPTPINNFAAITGDVSEANATTGVNYAILGIAAPLRRRDWAGYFIGNVGYTGSLVAVSDQKFKTKVNDEKNILTKLMELQPKNYFFDTEKNKNMGFNDKLQHGLISQEVEKIFPELVEEALGPNTSKDEKENGKPISFKGLNYIGFIPMLIKAVQELKVENDALKTKLETLESTATKNTFVINDKTNLPTEIENKAFTLSQNTPNPFSEKTTISYTIPSNVKKATLAVFDLTGKMLLQYNLLQGKNTLTISGNTLSAGMYLYSLIADGQEVVSKRMVLTK